MNQKKIEELELTDDFIFGEVMQNKEICKKTLEILLGIEIEEIAYPERQKAIEITYQGKSVRLDYSDKIIIPIFKSINLNLAIAVPCPA